MQQTDGAAADGDELMSTKLLFMLAFRLWVCSEHDCGVQQASMILISYQFNEPFRSPRKAPTNDGSAPGQVMDHFDEIQKLPWQFLSVPTVTTRKIHVSIPAGLGATQRNL